MKNKKKFHKLREEKKKRLEQKTRSRKTVIFVAVAIILLFGVLAVFEVIPLSVKFQEKDGTYTDPSTGKVYLPADFSVYELCGEYYPDEVYGTMSGDNVYVIKDVSKSKWLIRKHSDDLFTLYYEQTQILPSLFELEADKILICTDGGVVSVEAKVENSEHIAAVLQAIEKNERADKPDGAVRSYNLRFMSEKYPWLYYCVKYTVNEIGGYFYLYDENVYIKAGAVLDSYIEGIEE